MNNLIKQIIESKFNFNIDIEDSEKQNSLSKSKYNSKSLMQLYLDLYIVDFGLPSKTLWCKYNLDVDPNLLLTPKDWYGKYYAWGELEGNKTDEDGEIYFDWDNYKFGKDYNKLTKYCNNSNYGLNGFTDNLTLLLPEDDAAYQNKHIGNYKFHIPTKELCEELINCTTNYWVNNYDPNKIKHNQEDDNGIQGLNGRIFEVEGKNENYLFIPAAGYYDDFVIYDAGSGCNLWSSSLDIDDPCNAYIMYFDAYGNDMNSYDFHYYGFTIRPVMNL